MIKQWVIHSWDDGYLHFLFQLNLIWVKWNKPKVRKEIAYCAEWTHVELYFFPFNLHLAYR